MDLIINELLQQGPFLGLLTTITSGVFPNGFPHIT